jgi:hypothetical protein
VEVNVTKAEITERLYERVGMAKHEAGEIVELKNAINSNPPLEGTDERAD